MGECGKIKQIHAKFQFLPSTCTTFTVSFFSYVNSWGVKIAMRHFQGVKTGEKKNGFDKLSYFIIYFIEARQKQKKYSISLFIHQVVFPYASLDFSKVLKLFRAPWFFASVNKINSDAMLAVFCSLSTTLEEALASWRFFHGRRKHYGVRKTFVYKARCETCKEIIIHQKRLEFFGMTQFMDVKGKQYFLTQQD